MSKIDQKFSSPCGGCGATLQRERCIGCMHEMDATATTPVGDELVGVILTRIGQEFDGEAHFTDHEAHQIASRIQSLTASNEALEREREARGRLAVEAFVNTEINYATLTDKLQAAQAEIATLRENLETRDAWIVNRGQWGDFVGSLPTRRTVLSTPQEPK